MNAVAFNMHLCMDNIVFSLQRAGGISVYWSEIWCRLLRDAVQVTGIEATNANANLFRQDLGIQPHQLVHDNRPLRLARYLSAPTSPALPDIFHSSYYRLPANRKIPTVQTAYDFTYERYWRGPARWVHSAQKRRALKGADAIICISESTRRDLLEFCPGVRSDRTRVIHLGYSDAFFPLPPDSAHLVPPQVPPEQTFSVYVGDRSAYKNFRTAVDAVSLLPGHQLVVVGGGPLSEHDKNQLTSRLPDRWTHVDKAPGPLLNALYNRARALIYPSSYEGFGIPVIEAMAAGCPVVAVASSSIPEAAGDAGLLIAHPDPDLVAEQLRRMEDPALRHAVVEAGFQQAGRFSWERCYQETIRFYTEVQAR